MEHISKDLERLNRGKPTTHQNSTELIPENTEETREQKLEGLRRSLGLSSLEHTFENFRRVAGTGEALKAFKAMASDGHKPMLLCYGGVGNGKTHLCEALSIQLYKNGIRCSVIVWSDIIRRFKRGMDSKEYDIPSHGHQFEEFKCRERVILDDAGMGSSSTEWAWGELEDIINYRYQERLFTVVATNRDLDEMPERVVRRFNDSEVGGIVWNKGKEYRKE